MECGVEFRRQIKDNKKITRRYNEKLWELCVSISTCYFRYLHLSDRGYKENSKSTYNLSYERYGATIKVFTARTAIPPLLPCSRAKREEEKQGKDDISWNNTAIVDSIRFLPLIFLSQILPIWILLRYDDTAFRSRKEGRKEGRIVTRNERDGETLKGISYSFFLSRLKKKLGNNSIFFDQPRPFLTSWCWKKKVNILFEVKLLKEGNFFLSLSYTFGIQSNTI